MALEPRVALLDSHAHLISNDRERYRPAPLSGSLRPGDLDNPMTAEKFIREMDANNVVRALAVQRGHVYGYDNSYVCDASAAYSNRLMAVCSIDGLSSSCGDDVRYWVRERHAVGVRMMEPFKGADASWFAGENARSVWVAATELNIPVCVHFFAWNRDVGLPALTRLLQEFPNTAVVVDHFSNMHAEAGPPSYGVDDLLLALVDFPRVFIKYTTIPLGRLRAAGISSAPVVQRVVSAFGAPRVMWGSDIAQSVGTYEYMVRLGIESTALLSAGERAFVLHDTAAAVYGTANV